MKRIILLSVKPKYGALILNKEKSIEIRKIFPIDYRDKVLLFITNDKNQYLYRNASGVYKVFKYKGANALNGHIVGSFDCNDVEIIEHFFNVSLNQMDTQCRHTDCYELKCKARLTIDELNKYLGDKKGKAIHISNVEEFASPLKLSQLQLFKTFNSNDMHNLHKCLTRAPQNYCYVVWR